jgi:hypothetical protein
MANAPRLVDDVNEHGQSEDSSIGIQEKMDYDSAPKKTDSPRSSIIATFESKNDATYDELLGGNLPPTEEEDGAEGDTGTDIDDNQDNNEPSEWAHVSDFQTTETTDPDHIVHEDNSCTFQETVKRNRSCPYKYDDD